MNDLAKYARDHWTAPRPWPSLAAFDRYEQDLLDWNSCFNLTAIDHPENQGQALPGPADLPAGNAHANRADGRRWHRRRVPGIPLKIACPAMRLTLVEFVGKKLISAGTVKTSRWQT
jgi:hypothetical protein